MRRARSGPVNGVMQKLYAHERAMRSEASGSDRSPPGKLSGLGNLKFYPLQVGGGVVQERLDCTRFLAFPRPAEE